MMANEAMSDKEWSADALDFSSLHICESLESVTSVSKAISSENRLLKSSSIRF